MTPTNTALPAVNSSQNLDLNRIFTALQEARTKLAALDAAQHEPIAIVGMAGRFPGANSVQEFWQNLQAGKSGIRALTEAELAASGVPPEIWQQPNYVNAYASPENIAGFDAELFGYSPREAELIDPQHRLFLECAWEALEHAGHDAEQFPGKIAVYGGASMNGYLINLHSDRQLRETTDPVQVVVSNALGLMPMRVAHKLNLTGASCGIQTGCSTSLVTTHLACQSLRARDCDLAIAGGASVGILQKQGYLHQPNSILSPDGTCRAFDAAANGTLFGNGVGIVVLRRLSDAIADGNTIYATIQATAINNDGAQKVSLTAPSVTGQAAVIAAALQQARIQPTAVSYLETHGTGTPIGDPIELAALHKVYGQSEQPYCAIGSVKTNVGHLDAAAGVTGLIKTALMLHHQKLLPSLNFQTLNPQINPDRSPFYVNTQLQDWPGASRYAAVSSFGMGGTNAHAILASAPVSSALPDDSQPDDSRPDDSRPDDSQPDDSQLNPKPASHIIPLSAKTLTALKALCQNLQDYLRQHPTHLADVAYTLQTGRRSLDYRCAIVAETVEQAIDGLAQIQPSPESNKVAALPVAFLFSGQGSQYPGMAQDLYTVAPIFREWLDRGFAYLNAHCGLDLKSVLYPASESAGTNQLNQTQYSQPAIFLVEYALAQLLIQAGIEPQAMLGHSIGEYVAATLAGVFEFETALELTALRGRFMQACEPGVMLSVSQSAADVQTLMPPQCYIAVINAPTLCVVSGNSAAIAQLEQILTQQNIPHRRLQTSHGFHSPLMQAAATRLQRHLATIQLKSPQQPWISNLTGTWIDPQQVVQPQYWVDHLLSPVQFAAGLAQIPAHALIEVGPSTILCSLAKQNGVTSPIIPLNRHPQDRQSDRTALAKAIAQLWQQGVKISWQGLSAPQRGNRIALPTYPFEHQSYWVELKTEAAAQNRPKDTPALAPKADPSDWFYLPNWQRSPRLKAAEPEPTAGQHTWRVYSPSPDVVQQWQQLTEPAALNLEPLTLESLSGDSAVQCDRLLVDFGAAAIAPSQVLELLRAMVPAAPRLDLITHQAQSVIGSEALNPDQAMLQGFLQVLTQEYPAVTCRIMDVDRHSQAGVLAELAESPPEGFSLVAYRHGQRWQQTFTPIRLEASAVSIQPKRTYLIAGEMLDSLCPSYAEWIGKDCGADLLLLGSPHLPSMPQWEAWLATHGPEDAVSRWIQALQALAIAGVKVQFMPVDLTDRQALDAALADSAGQIAGVIYTGTMGDRNSCLISRLTPEVLTAQITQKTASLLNLEQALPLPDFFLIQSSLSAIAGGLGFAAYAAAHHRLDAMVQQRAQAAVAHPTAPRWISVNWDAVALDDRVLADGLASQWLMQAIPKVQVSQLTARILASGLTAQVIISPTDLARRLSQASESAGGLSPEQTDPQAQHARPQMSAAYVAPRTPTEQRIADLMQSLLGIAQIGVEDNFFELGGHSLLAIQAVSQLREAFQVDIPMRQFLFESPTVAGIATIIEAHQATLQLDLAEQLLAEIEDSP
jgi:acyl transferase domain-containing protein/acyl carrier protein